MKKPSSNKPYSADRKPIFRLDKKSFLFLTLCGLALYLSQMHMILTTHLKNGEFLTANYHIMEEDFFHPRLQLLRSRENLDKVVSTGKTQLEKIILLRHWSHEQWSGGNNNFYYPPWDAVEILDLSRSCHNLAFCAQYAIVFLQACQSLGIHARYIDLPGHFVAAVWSDDYNQWVVMDPTADIHYEKDGIPLKGRALCKAYWKNDVQGIYKVDSNGIKTQITRNELFLYRKYSILLRSDQLTHPVNIVHNGVKKTLLHQPNYHDYPHVGPDSLEIRTDVLAWKQPGASEFFTDREMSDDPDDFRHVENQTLIFIAKQDKSKGLVKIKLEAENSPTFKTFQVNIDHKGWIGSNDKVLWKLHPGFNKLFARILTKYGWQCPESAITLFYK